VKKLEVANVAASFFFVKLAQVPGDFFRMEMPMFAILSKAK
jgi:hypothetical protein